MDINEELEQLFNDPLMDVSEDEKRLFEMPDDMRRVEKAKKLKERPDFVAQRRPCDDFDRYASLFAEVHADLRAGRRSLLRITKTDNLEKNHFFIVAGQLLLLQDIGETTRGANGLPDGRTRCIYENGTESDILLQTLRKNVVGDGYAVTETQEESHQGFYAATDVTDSDRMTGYVYVLQSLSTDPRIHDVDNLYKIGFSTNRVEERIANASHEPTYLMAPVKVVSSYKIVNMHSQKFEQLLHQVLEGANFKVRVIGDDGRPHDATEWYVVPLPIIEAIMVRIADGSIVNYIYNVETQCLEQRQAKRQSALDLKGLKVLTLNIKKIYFDEIVSGVKKEEYREIKQTTINRYTYVDEADGKRYLRRYDLLHLFVGYHKDRESAVVEVTDTTVEDGWVVYHLGRVIEVLR